ncbi:MAG: phospholipase D family protein [Verrucomicrobia bacterium]|nr:phospholipase D family protein [Verrucomicrobiota bacterium]
MASIRFLLQAVTADFHAKALRKLLAAPAMERVVASVAFVRQDGVEAIARQLKAVANVTTFFVGIRNDITSIQAILKLLKLGVRVFVVDTASRSTIFHPKVFLAKGATAATVIIGSANMTFAGLHNNIEAGAIIELNFDDPSDKSLIESVFRVFDDLPAHFPEHVFAVNNARAVRSLLKDGRLADESVVVAPAITSTVRKSVRDHLKSMKLERHAPPSHKRPAVKPKRRGAIPSPKRTGPDRRFLLVWESRGLTERDLNIPSGSKTHATGSMLRKKGASEDIDQRHYFRDDVFAGLYWQTDRALPHYERAEAIFQICVKGLHYGSFKLKLSHNTNTESKSYKQMNSMTQIHWGTALRIIASPDLLGRTMYLYRKDDSPPQFIIEID